MSGQVGFREGFVEREWTMGSERWGYDAHEAGAFLHLSFNSYFLFRIILDGFIELVKLSLDFSPPFIQVELPSSSEHLNQRIVPLVSVVSIDTYCSSHAPIRSSWLLDFAHSATS